ncbi:MAG: Cupin 2, conserved barrel [Verrucomicrobiaceae bacterium]|nr:Cupin 2, conserved barrel [Verrucomicrobiaceae bacterium]
MKHAIPSTRREAIALFATALTSGLFSSTTSQAHEADGEVKAQPVFQKELAGHEGEQVSMTVVSYPPGTSSKPHKHHGPVFVYVLEGTLELQITNGPLTTVKAGETFYEPPGGVHLVSRNASSTAPAKLLAFIVGKTSTPVTSAAE